MDNWKKQAEDLYFEGKKSIQEVATATGISRQSISGYLKTLPRFPEEKARRKSENREKRKVYKREMNRKYREEYRNMVTPETIKREHDIAVMLLSHER
jgi:predicted DNA-binding protein YlxM (UPF0122 family)